MRRPLLLALALFAAFCLSLWRDDVLRQRADDEAWHARWERVSQQYLDEATRRHPSTPEAPVVTYYNGTSWTTATTTAATTGTFVTTATSTTLPTIVTCNQVLQ